MSNLVRLVVLTGLLAGCADPEPQPSVPTLARDVQPILDHNCAVDGCHGGALVEAELRLESGRAADSLIGAPSTQVPGATRVVPGDVDASLLPRVLRAPVERDPPVFGMPLVERMPRDTSPLAPAEIELIEAWIAAGAPLE